MTMDFETFEKRLMSDPEFRKEVNKSDLRREISRMIIEARIVKGLTQEKLAELVGTKQPSIARLENGKSLPSLKFLKKIADALKSRLIVVFDFLLLDNVQLASESVTALAVFSGDEPKKKDKIEPMQHYLLTTKQSYSSQRWFDERL